MSRLSASGYAACFDVERLSILCAQYDKVIDELGAENKRLKSESEKLRDLVRHLYVCNFNTSLECARIHCEQCSYDSEKGDCDFEKLLRELGFEVD